MTAESSGPLVLFGDAVLPDGVGLERDAADEGRARVGQRYVLLAPLGHPHEQIIAVTDSGPATDAGS